MKDVFLSTASHELKTPLTSVIAYAELLDDNEGRLTRDQRGEFVRRLRGEAGRLLGLIDDILDLSRLESGKLVLKRVAVAVAGAHPRGGRDLALAGEQARRVGRGRRSRTTLPPLQVDEVKIRQVVVNLLVNAIKFSPRAADA